MQDPEASSKRDAPDDLRTSHGEAVRRIDLDRAAGTFGRWIVDQDLARHALAGDQAALDRFHDLAGLALPGVTEYAEGEAVRLTTETVGEVFGGTSCEVPPHRGEERLVFVAWNECGYRNTRVDAAEFVVWVLSPEGRAALARRGVVIPAPITDEDRMSVATDALASIANVLGIEGGPTPWIENTRDAVLAEIRRLAAKAKVNESGGATSVATTYNPTEVERLIVEVCEDEGRLLTAVPNCTCTGWYDTPGNSHEWSCARTRHATDLDSATRRLRDGNLRAMISQLQALRDLHAANRVLIAKLDANFGRVIEALGLAPGRADTATMIACIALHRENTRTVESQTASTRRVHEVVREIAAWVLARFEEQGKLNADPVAISIADRVAAKLAQDPLHARVAELETGLREACDHIDDLHLPDPGLRAESVRLRALAGKP